MDIVVVGRHTKVSEEFRVKVAEKLQKIETLDSRATRIDVHVVHERNPKIADERERVELTVHGHRSIVRAEAASEDRYLALDIAVDRLVERLRKRHERGVQRHQGRIGGGKPEARPAVPSPTTSVEAWEGAPDSATREISLDGTPIIIRSKIHSAAPMTTSEAIDRMELVGHDFYLFHDSESGLPSAVYRRRGWTYGVIHLEREAGQLSPDRHETLQESA